MPVVAAAMTLAYVLPQTYESIDVIEDLLIDQGAWLGDDVSQFRFALNSMGVAHEVSDPSSGVLQEYSPYK